ncbi:hypothetical protein MHM84_05760 [Halomonas sp. McH1-25]|uniref:hypothetical protein n=1 Tax=unclassified Halomonas TaxID=2609666 RepID=UPI001EF6BB55|nr:MULTISPECIES: hypothetical protein [unclassified Halomonas]MCG7599284.1 hypothetical protein [Halomonas sp. McH1-25]MCP1341152.1 hypothetical protein [Halomonas sp. FL8]MCP1360254.1 hypothetical protein [Halomonas sp. BBD45]MCP1365394.1 hypothetical protein [Halomonas sp. BBD48]
MKKLLAGMMLAAAVPAFADGTATIASNDSQQDMQIQWAGDKMRMDFPSQQHGYMLMRDGKGYMVTQQGGQPLIMDMSMLRDMSDSMGDDTGAMASQAETVDSLEATGETQTVAGIDGEVYRLEWTDRGGQSHEDTLVLSDDPLAHEMLAAFQNYVEAVMGRADPIGKAILERDLGMLRFGDRFEVTDIADTSPDAGTFELPENAITMDQMIRERMSDGAQ